MFGGWRRRDFALLQKILSKFGQRLGALEDTECKVMKNKMTSLEDEYGSGAVRLGDFYGDKAEYHFTEAPSFLRRNGVLDESVPEDPKVLIPNYLANPSNCVTPAGCYSICCFDECESLMDQVEKSLGSAYGYRRADRHGGLWLGLRVPTSQPHVVRPSAGSSRRCGGTPRWHGADSWSSLCTVDA